MIGEDVIEEMREALLESFDSGESFLIFCRTLKRFLNISTAILFEIDWNNLVLIPTKVYPPRAEELLSDTTLSISPNSSVHDLFTRDWIKLAEGFACCESEKSRQNGKSKPLFLFPLRVKQRVLGAIGISCVSLKDEVELEKLDYLIAKIAPILEKNMVIAKAVRKNQRLETIIGSGEKSYFVVNRAGVICDYFPCNENFLNYASDDVIGKPIDSIIEKGEDVLNSLWGLKDKEQKGTLILLKKLSRKKSLASLSFDRVFLKYESRKEYHLMGLESLEEDLFREFPTSISPSKTRQDSFPGIQIFYCPEHLTCIRQEKRKFSYMGEGKFACNQALPGDMNCISQTRCIARVSSIRNHPGCKIIKQ